ncbi:MAG: hypothetical protein HZC14_01765 [Candidatus Niyogibacteria bacterium]|nr:hypothetical protein [Candidatus Niyogibacteria bacterium]
MARPISNRRLFRSLDDFLIVKEERQAKRARVAAQSDHHPRERRKEPVLAAEKPAESGASEHVIAESALENVPTFEPRHQIFRMHGVIVRKGDKIHESHGPRGREKKLLCDRRQTIRHI